MSTLDSLVKPYLLFSSFEYRKPFQQPVTHPLHYIRLHRVKHIPCVYFPLHCYTPPKQLFGNAERANHFLKYTIRQLNWTAFKANDWFKHITEVYTDLQAVVKEMTKPTHIFSLTSHTIVHNVGWRVVKGTWNQTCVLLLVVNNSALLTLTPAWCPFPFRRGGAGGAQEGRDSQPYRISSLSAAAAYC